MINRPLPTVLTVLVGGFVFFVLAVVVFGFVLDGVLESTLVPHESLRREMPSLPLLFIGDVLWALFIFWMIRSSGSRGKRSGAIIGGAAMTMVGASTIVHDIATMDLYQNHALLIIDILAMALIGAITGIIIQSLVDRGTSVPGTGDDAAWSSGYDARAT